MHKLFIIFLLLIQTFLLSANAGEINLSALNCNKHIEYISTQKTTQKRISIDFKNYENAIINEGSKTQEIFEHRNSNNINGYFIGFLNHDFINNIALYSFKQNLLIDNHFIYFHLKSEIQTRAP